MLRWAEGHATFYLKIYRYPGLRGPLRGAFRNTFAAPSRAAREDRTLRHLADRGVQPGLAAGFEERRCLGFLREARLLTRGFGDGDLAQALAAGPLPGAELDRLADFVAAMFDSGVRDPDLVARNLLREGRGDACRFAKIDASSSWILARPLRATERAVDLAHFLGELAHAGHAATELERFALRTRARS